MVISELLNVELVVRNLIDFVVKRLDEVEFTS